MIPWEQYGYEEGFSDEPCDVCGMLPCECVPEPRRCACGASTSGVMALPRAVPGVHCGMRSCVNRLRQAVIWTDGPDSEAARAARGEGHSSGRRWRDLHLKVSGWEDEAYSSGMPYSDWHPGRENAFAAVRDEMEEVDPSLLRHRDEKAGCR